MMALTAKVNSLSDLTGAYVKASGKSVPEVIAKMAKKLGITLNRMLLQLRAPKGAIKEQLLARLKAGKFITIRAGAYQFVAESMAARAAATGERQKAAWMAGKTVRAGKLQNAQQLAVKREIGMRASARGFTGQTAAFRGDGTFTTQALARSGVALSLYSYKSEGAATVARFNWGSLSSQLSKEAAEAVGTPKAQTVMENAITAVTQDTLEYHRFSEEFRARFIQEANATLKTIR